MVSEVEKDIQVLREFIQIYCDTKHKDFSKTYENGILLCTFCHDTLSYSTWRRNTCPLVPKPTCKNCEIHCYHPKQRAKIKEIMRHSGLALIKRGRLDLIFHYLF
jgi:hypothetical protein